MTTVKHLDERVLDLALEEDLAGVHPPDFRSRILGADASRRRRAVDRVDAATAALQAIEPPPSVWPIALVAVAASLVVVVALRVNWPAVAAAIQQKPDRAVVTPRGFGHWKKLLSSVESIRLKQRTRDPIAVTLDEQGTERVRAALASPWDKKGEVCRHEPERELEILLSKKRVVYARLARTRFGSDDLVLVVDGVKSRPVDGKLEEVLAPWFTRLADKARPATAIVNGNKELGELAADRRAASKVESLVGRSIDSRGIDALGHLPRLRSLDVALSRHFDPARLVGSDAGKRLTSLTIRTDHVGARPTWLGDFPRLENLCVGTEKWYRSRLFLGGRNCAGCHLPRPKQPATERVPNLSVLTKKRTIRRLALLGVILDDEFGELLPGLPHLESLDLSGCDLDSFDTRVFARLPMLRELSLVGCSGFDKKDVDRIARLRGLRRLDLRGIDVEALDTIRQALTMCEVRY